MKDGFEKKDLLQAIEFYNVVLKHSYDWKKIDDLKDFLYGMGVGKGLCFFFWHKMNIDTYNGGFRKYWNKYLKDPMETKVSPDPGHAKNIEQAKYFLELKIQVLKWELGILEFENLKNG